MPKEKRRSSLKTVGLSVLAMIKMKKRQENWAGAKELQMALVKKLNSVRKAKAKARGREELV